MTTFVLLLDWVGFEKDRYVHTVLEDNLLPDFLEQTRWFAGKSRVGYTLKITDVTRFLTDGNTYFFSNLRVKYSEGDSEVYMLTFSFISDQMANKTEGLAVISSAVLDDVEGFLVEGISDPAFRSALFRNILENQQIDQKVDNQFLAFERGKALVDDEVLESYIPAIDSSNTAVIYGEKYFFKLYRKLFTETNPEAEMVQFITQNSDFKHIPRYAGCITHHRSDDEDLTYGLLVEIIENEKDNWSKTGDYLNDFIKAFIDGDFEIKENVFSKVSLLGIRTAQMHESLFHLSAEEGFRAESFDRGYRRLIHQKVEDLLNQRYELLTDNFLKLDQQSQSLAWRFMEAKDLILDFVDQVLTRPITSYRTRVHGDYHLGQVLVCNEDLVIIDFEGEPESSISSRKIKHSPLKDVAGMIRSYHYAVSAKLYNAHETRLLDEKILQRAADRWYKLMRDTFLDEYLNYFGVEHPLLKNNNEINYLLQFHLLEKAVYELGYELNYRPDWVKIPLKGIVDVLYEVEKLRK